MEKKEYKAAYKRFFCDKTILLLLGLVFAIDFYSKGIRGVVLTLIGIMIAIPLTVHVDKIMVLLKERKKIKEEIGREQ